MAEQADDGDHQHDEGQHNRQAGQHLQFEVLQIGAQRQAQCSDQGEERDTPADLGFAEGQGDQHRGEGTQRLDADQVAQYQDHQNPDRDHDHHLVNLLGMQWQAVQRILQQSGGAIVGAHLGKAQRVHLAVVDGHADTTLPAALQAEHRRVSGPPDHAVLRNALLAGFRVEIQPALAVMAAQPQFGLLVGDAFQPDGVHHLQRNARIGQQYVDYARLVQRRGLAAQQQTHVVVTGVVDAANGFGDEGFDIGRVLPYRADEGVGRHLLRTFQHDWHSRRGGRGRRCVGCIALGQNQSVIQRLRTTGAPGGPGDPAIALDLIDAHPVVVGDEALVQAGVVLIQRRNEHLRLDRHARGGLEFQARVQTPDVVRLIFSHRYFQNVDLVSRYRQAQADQQGNQDLQVQVNRLH